jgi:hypothetical protein
MATTTNYGWDTPDDTDLVKDGAAAIRTLGSSIDTTTKNLNPQTTTGAIAYRSATANVNTSLAIGTAGQVLKVNSGATAPEWGAAPSSANATAEVTTQQETTSTTYTDLVTSGPAVTITTGTKALVIVGASQEGGDPNSPSMSFAVSGASTVAANDKWAWQTRDNNANNGSKAYLLTGLTAGSNTFTAKYKTSGGTSYFRNRNIIVIDMGS